MRRRVLAAIVCAPIAIGLILAPIAVLADGISAPGGNVALQATSPGTAQSGNANVTGTIIAGTKLAAGGGTTSATTTTTALADSAATGHTTVNNSNTVTCSDTCAFLSEIYPGDRIAVSSASSTFRIVSGVLSDSSLTVESPIGDGTSQTITVRHAIANWYDRTGAFRFAVDTGGTIFSEATATMDTDLFVSSASGPQAIFRKGRGSPTAPAAAQADDAMGNIAFNAWGTTKFGSASSIGFAASELQSDTANGSYFIVKTIANTTTTATERMRVANDGTLTLSGYGTYGVGVLSAAGVLSTVAPGSSGNVLTSNGTAWTSAAAAGGASEHDFSAFNAGGLASATALSRSKVTNASTLTADSTITIDSAGNGTGPVVVKLCSDGVTCGAGNVYLTCTPTGADCTAAAGTITACSVTKAAVSAATTLTWSVATACGVSDPFFNVVAHMTSP